MTTPLLTVEQLLELRQPSEVALTSDGRRIAFVVSGIAADPQGAQSRIWLGDTGGEVAEATRGPGSDALPRWSGDGSRLAFASDRAHKGLMSLHLLENLAEARPLGNITGSVEDVQWSSDDTHLLVLAADPGSDRAGGQKATRIEASDASQEDPVVRRPAQAWRRLYLVEVATGATREVSPARVNVWEVGWAGGRDAVAIVSDDPSESAWYSARVGLLDLEACAAKTIYESERQLQSPVMSSDGSHVAFVEGLNSDRTVLAGTATVVDLSSGRASALAGHLDVTSLRWVESGRLFYVGLRGVQTMCGTIALDGTVDEISGGDATLGRTHRLAAECSRDGSVVAACREAPGEPAEVAVIDVGASPRKWKPITTLNTAIAGFGVPSTERFTWTASDGLELDGILLRPTGGGDRLPLVVIVHGGPTNAWTLNYLAGYNGHGLLLGNAGYAVLLPNPRGSSGRGQDFARANLGDMGGADLRDILDGIESLAAAGIVDRRRVGITGGSYGGFMSAWAVTQTDAFAAAVPSACVSDWLSFHNTTNIGQFDRLFLQSDPYDADGDYLTRSPVMHARNSTTPTLIVHGELDLCTPLGQATEFYEALVEAGCVAELVVYPREGHGIVEREHQIDLWGRVEEWFGRYLQVDRKPR